MLFDLPYLTIGCKCQWVVNSTNDRENTKHINHDYAIGAKVLIINEDEDHKVGDKHFGPFTTIQAHINGIGRIQCGCITQCINIRRLMLYFEEKRLHTLLKPFCPYLNWSEELCLKTWGCIVFIN